MTKKTEMVSEFASLTYKEIAERLAHYLSSALVSAQYSMTDETMHDALGLCDQVTRRKATTAEDVRAVVDEPVAWLCEANADSERRGKWLQYSKEIRDPWHQSEVNTTPLYRHPQRPVVMPERKSHHLDQSFLPDGDKGWNDCLDRIAELNK